MTPRSSHILLAFGAVLVVLGLTVFALDAYHKRQSAQAETASHVAAGEANAHVQQAQAIPDHSKELQSAKDDVARARAEVARVKRILAANQGHAVPDQPGPSPALPQAVDPDPRDSVIASQDVLIKAQDQQIKGLEIALSDKTRQSDEYKAAFEAERRRAVGLEIALATQKKVNESSKWIARFEGFAIGLGSGYVAGRLK